MTPYQFECPNCEKRLESDRSGAAKCTRCNRSYRITSENPFTILEHNEPAEAA